MKIIDAKPLANFRVQLMFDSGEAGIVDLAHLAGHGVFEAWNLPEVFEAVKVTDYGAIEWPGEIDLCPDSLYLRMTGRLPGDLQPNNQAQIQSHA
jgi:hypothetical protein